MKGRTKRLRDFMERVSEDPGGVRMCGDLGRYVAINPLSDDRDLLSHLKLDATTCIKVDLYWEYRGDVMFVQIMTRGYAPMRAIGLHVRMASSGYVNIVAVVPDDFVDSLLVKRVLKDISNRKIRLDELSSTLKPLPTQE